MNMNPRNSCYRIRKVADNRWRLILYRLYSYSLLNPNNYLFRNLMTVESNRLYSVQMDGSYKTDYPNKSLFRNQRWADNMLKKRVYRNNSSNPSNNMCHIHKLAENSKHRYLNQPYTHTFPDPNSSPHHIH